jgi:5-methylcytosine-specific restriction endonuclease McrA
VADHAARPEGQAAVTRKSDTMAAKRERKRMRAKLFAAQAGICALCGAPMLPTIRDVADMRVMATIDHIEPRALGGSDERANLRAVHHGCNSTRDHLNIVGVPLVLS